MKIRISVTANDIKNGRYNSCRLCPIALSLSRRIKSECQILIGRTKCAGWLTETKEFIIKLPPKAIEFIDRFDSWRKVNPMTFEINVNKKCLRTKRWRSRIEPIDRWAILSEIVGALTAK